MSDLKKQKPDEPAVKKFFMHGVSHPIGLDVHDVTYNHFRIEPGWVLTVEPAIYIKEEGFGVRIENTVVVTETGQLDLMAGIPIEADEIFKQDLDILVDLNCDLVSLYHNFDDFDKKEHIQKYFQCNQKPL